MSSKIESLTPEQEAQLILFRDEWLAIGRATGPANMDVVKPIISDFYKRIGKPAPEFIQSPSPYSANLLLNQIDGGPMNDQVGGEEKKLKYYYTYMWGSIDSFWIAYYLFPHLHLRKIYTDKQFELLSEWAELAKNCFWWYPFEKLCIVCDRPSSLALDGQGRLHNESGPAMAFSDGYSLYAIHGVSLPEYVIMHPEEITPAKILDQENAEVQRVMIERFGGDDRFVAESGLQPVQKDKYGELYRVEFKNGDEPLVMVHVIDASTERSYWLGVPANMQTAHQAVAWTFGLTPSEYDPLVET